MKSPATLYRSPSTVSFDRSKLALSYDVDCLQKEVLQVIAQYPPYIYYSAIPLTMPGERNANITDFSDPDWTTWIKTKVLNECPYIQSVLSSLDCRTTNVRILRLESGGEIKAHTDPQLNVQFRNQVRLHIPIFTTEQVEFLLNGVPVPLRPGELWYMRLSDPHSVINNGPTERIHLSIDVVVNDWIETMIAQGYIA